MKNKSMIKQLQSAVNMFFGKIVGLNAKDSVKNVMQKHDIFSINQLKELETANFYINIFDMIAYNFS